MECVDYNNYTDEMCEASLPCGRVAIREETDYPYSGKVRICIEGGAGRFPLFVRVPRWAQAADAPGRAVDPPSSPLAPSCCSETETIRLVPLAETQIRITLFPWLFF